MPDYVRDALTTLHGITRGEIKDAAGLSASDRNTVAHLLGIRKWGPLQNEKAKAICWKYRRQLHHWGFVWDDQRKIGKT